MEQNFTLDLRKVIKKEMEESVDNALSAQTFQDQSHILSISTETKHVTPDLKIEIKKEIEQDVDQDLVTHTCQSQSENLSLLDDMKQDFTLEQETIKIKRNIEEEAFIETLEQNYTNIIPDDDCDFIENQLQVRFMRQEKRTIDDELTEESQEKKLKGSPLLAEGNQVKTSECPTCNKTFSSSSDLQKHQMIHTGELTFKCELCLKVYSCSGNLKRHQLVHTGDKLFVCEICHIPYSSPSYLKKHQAAHTGSSCKICHQVFHNSSDLKIHQTVHSDEKGLNCQLSLKGLECPTSMKVFVCHVCLKVFPSSWKLNRHLLVHTGEKTFKCQTCPKTFSLSYYLKKHQLVHADK